MTHEEALDLAVHVLGTSAFCENCDSCCFFGHYKLARPTGKESDAAFGRWLLQEGWRFSWEEHGDGWTFRFLCPACAAERQ